MLGFQLAHAQARDAVHARLETAKPGRRHSRCRPGRLRDSAAFRRSGSRDLPAAARTSDACSTEGSREVLARIEPAACDLVLVVADGLSALAVERHVPGMLAELLPRLVDWRIAPVCIVEQGRVAIGDEIGSLLRAELSVILIGERPGLSSPDSLGAYITWQPQPGRTDAERNCISNIRSEGLGYRDAAAQVMNCLADAKRHKLTGTALAEAARKLRNGLPDGREP